MSIDWNDPEQVKQYKKDWYQANRPHVQELHRRWRADHPEYKEQYNAKRREERRNQPAAPGGKGKRGRKPIGNFEDVAYSIENFQDEISWDIDLGKYMEGNVNE